MKKEYTEDEIERKKRHMYWYMKELNRQTDYKEYCDKNGGW